MVAKKANKSSRYLEEAMREEEDYRVRVYSVIEPWLACLSIYSDKMQEKIAWYT